MLGDIKSFFGVKQEEQDPHEVDRKVLSTETDEDKIKSEAPSAIAGSAASPLRGGSNSQGSSSLQTSGFMKASSLLGKRQHEDAPGTTTKSPGKLKSPAKPKRRVADPKQGSLLSFFQPSNPN